MCDVDPIVGRAAAVGGGEANARHRGLPHPRQAAAHQNRGEKLKEDQAQN